MNYDEREKKTLKKRFAQFVKLGKEKYGEHTYDYSLAEKQYKNNRTPVELKCNRCNSAPYTVLPFVHTYKGINDKGTCPNCYVPKKTIGDTRWDPNRLERARVLRELLEKRHGSKYSYPKLEDEFSNENSRITIICNKCKYSYTRNVASMKVKNRPFVCEKCNAKTMKKKIQEKNSKRQKRNHQDADKPKEYGCIYKITNEKNEKFYIGYSTMSAKSRFKSHCDEVRRLEKGHQKAKSYLHNAMSHHGCKNFSVEILEEFTDISPVELGEHEQQYIKLLDPDYNVSPGGELANYRSKQKAKEQKDVTK